MTLKTLTIALVCGTAQAGYSISSMLTTRRKKTPGSAGSTDGPSDEIEALAGESFDWLANLGAPAALVAGAIMATLVDVATHDLLPQQAHELLRVVLSYDC